MAWRSEIDEHTKKIVVEPRFGCERSLCSPRRSGEEQLSWNRGLERFEVQAGSRSRGILDRGAVETLNPPQRGLGVTGKSSTPRKKFLSLVW